MFALLRLPLWVLLLVASTAMGSPRHGRGTFAHRPRGQSVRPPPRALVRDWGHDRWVERDAPNPFIPSTSSTSVTGSSVSNSTVTGASTSNSGASKLSRQAQFGDFSTSSAQSSSVSMSSTGLSNSMSFSASTPSSSIVSSIPSSSASSASASSSASSNSSFLDPNGWHYPYMALWNGTAPNLEDVKQGRIANCWMPASSIAVVYSSPEWVSNLFTYTDGTPMVGQSYPTAPDIVVQLWHPWNGWQYQFPVNIYNESTTEDYPGGNWWHSALSQAFQGMGQVTTLTGINMDGSWNQTQGAPDQALAMMTGRFANRFLVGPGMDISTVDDFFAACANATFTPIVLASKHVTKVTEPQITEDHDYAVMNVTDQGQAGRFVNVRNPWGMYQTFTVEDLFNNIFFFYILADQSPLVWQD